ncbi:MAG: DUF3343 domain-containing protein [Clostridia bacterium]|nr:DUF3343 domain-containing protein [Clostridia bacterium]
MTYILAVVGAITSATRLAAQLEKQGCKDLRVIRTPYDISIGGCSYSVRMKESCLQQLYSVLNHRRFKAKKIYRVTENDRECDYDDIS